MEKAKKFIPLVIGIALIGFGVFTYFRTGELVRVCTEKTTATVVDMREDFDASNDTIRYVYYPIIEYTVNDQLVEQELSSGSNTPAYRIGETLEILYNPNNVKEFLVAGENQNLSWILASAVGVVFLVVGIVVLVKK